MWIYEFDFGVLDFIRENIVCPPLDAVMKIFTYGGSGGAVWIAVSLCMMFSRSKELRTTGIIMAAMLVMTLLFDNILLKNLIARPRPFVQRPDIILSISPPGGYSFPSGHSCSSFGGAAVIGMRVKKRAVRAAVWAAAALIAFSRLYFYVHFPTDVIAGAVLGCVLGIACVWAGEKISVSIDRRSDS
ncbi:MAG: phosphatase PAP2 family protein [Oscillospiraceae bacterium]|nr:phosphatase PAP2 family protein [Oscillospiraceae bacterium]